MEELQQKHQKLCTELSEQHGEVIDTDKCVSNSFGASITSVKTATGGIELATRSE